MEYNILQAGSSEMSDALERLIAMVNADIKDEGTPVGGAALVQKTWWVLHGLADHGI
ncbi:MULTISPECIES: hypothetical protein [Cupriavidus]|uniref:hypothetical protein n=1 Tax=Cupriavidus sp. DF5525 TaxID=3160989 RepID=UPI0032DEDB2B